MATEILVRRWCDVHLRDDRGNQKVEVTETGESRLLSWHGEEVELDLCGECILTLDADLKPYLEAGRVPESSGKRTSGAPTKKPRTYSRGSRQYYAAMRGFAHQVGISVQTDSAGKYTYPKSLRERFDATDEGKRLKTKA